MTASGCESSGVTTRYDRRATACGGPAWERGQVRRKRRPYVVARNAWLRGWIGARFHGYGSERDELDDLLGGVDEVGDGLCFLGDGRVGERALREFVGRADVGGVNGELDVDLGTSPISKAFFS